MEQKRIEIQFGQTGKNQVAKISALGVVAALMLSVNAADAGKRVKGQYGTSKQPYWNVGKIDKALTGACQRGEFRQRKLAMYSIGYIGKQGRGLTGIAKKNWNLIDPKGLAKDGFTYHFFNQGYSNCKVYVAKTPARRDDDDDD